MSNWKEVYKSKLVSAKEAVSLIESGDRIFVGNNISIPTVLVEELAERKDELENVTVFGGTCLYPYKILKSNEYRGKIDFVTNFMAGYELALKGNGNVGVNSVPFCRLTESLINILHVNVLMVECSAPDEDGYVSFGVAGVAGCPEVAAVAQKIILQINHNQAQLKNDPYHFHISKATCIFEHDSELGEFPQGAATEEELKMVEYLLPFIEDGSTLQLGLGGLPNALGYRLESRKNLSVHTEMYTDSMAYLAKKGVINGKQTAAFALGCKDMIEYASQGAVEFKPISIVNDPYEMSKVDKLISINACLMADLTGQVCSEAIGYRQYSCTGGQLDFVRGAALSKGGKSFLCCSSIYKSKDGKVESRIKATLPPGSIVTTPRSDVMYIVTEYGIADLWLKPIEQRVEAMIAIAHPDFRAQLREEAIKSGIIRG